LAFSLPLPRRLAGHWKVKIRDRERAEPPHVTILHGTREWRLCLRTGRFLDVDPPARLVPTQLVRYVEGRFARLIEEWDRRYPSNPVWSQEDEDA
jgi:hypothetical protein